MPKSACCMPNVPGSACCMQVEGGGGIVVAEAMCVYGLILDNDPDRKEELAALRRRAAEMGCDVSDLP